MFLIWKQLYHELELITNVKEFILKETWELPCISDLYKIILCKKPVRIYKIMIQETGETIMTNMNQETVDIMLIRDQIERWVVYRDSFQWDKFRTVWHPDGIMKATWTEGSFEDFIEITK